MASAPTYTVLSAAGPGGSLAMFNMPVTSDPIVAMEIRSEDWSAFS
jgi:hypothetical protein